MNTNTHKNSFQGEAPKKIEVVTFTPPAVEQRVRRNADFVAPGAKKGRYDLPERLDSSSPVGFRTRVALTEEEGAQALERLAMSRPVRLLANRESPL